MITKEDAVTNLRPDTEWVMRGNDVATIEWITPDVEPLTEAEVAAEMQRLEQVAADKAQADEEARTAAITHAKSLGFTDAMIAVMYPNLGA